MVRCTGLIPCVPSGEDFPNAIAFFEALGFSVAWQTDDLAGMRFGAAYFLLQRIVNPVWQENQMLIIEVDDLDAYWAELVAKDLAARFSNVRLRPPQDYPWGREAHIVDPSGVCWHVRSESRR